MSVISLKYGTSTAVIQQKGAQMLSFKGSDGREVMWQGDSVWEDSSPVLFPVCGSPKDMRVIVDDIAYPMPQHGFASKYDFEIVKYGEDFVDLALSANENTMKAYPFDFVFHVITLKIIIIEWLQESALAGIF